MFLKALLNQSNHSMLGSGQISSIRSEACQTQCLHQLFSFHGTPTFPNEIKYCHLFSQHNKHHMFCPPCALPLPAETPFFGRHRLECWKAGRFCCFLSPCIIPSWSQWRLLEKISKKHSLDTQDTQLRKSQNKYHHLFWKQPSACNTNGKKAFSKQRRHAHTSFCTTLLSTTANQFLLCRL